MQPLSGPGAQPPGDRATLATQPGQTRSGSAGDQPLSPAQRTTLERLIVRIMSLSPLKPAELWAGLRHEVGVKNDGELLSRHFPAGEQFLNTRLTQVQESHATRQLFQQLTDLLPQGNNRQAVSDFIRQQFGHTVLSSLTQNQLHQVVTMLQNGQLAIPQPQHSSVTDRTLLPAEHHTLNQQIARLAAATGESPVKLWSSVLKLVNLNSGDPIPSRHFPLLTQYLQARLTLTQLNAPTLQQVEASLKQPLNHAEQQQIEQYSQQRFQTAPQTAAQTQSGTQAQTSAQAQAATQAQTAAQPLDHAEQQQLEQYNLQRFQATPQMVLTAAQAQDLLNFIFSRRAEKLLEMPLADSELNPKPIYHPLVGTLPSVLQPLANRPTFTAFAVVVVVLFLMWIVL